MQDSPRGRIPEGLAVRWRHPVSESGQSCASAGPGPRFEWVQSPGLGTYRLRRGRCCQRSSAWACWGRWLACALAAMGWIMCVQGCGWGCGWVPRVRLYPFLGSPSWSVCRNDIADALMMVCSSWPWLFYTSSAGTHLPSRCTRGDSIATKRAFLVQTTRGLAGCVVRSALAAGRTART